jgi:hypothetical protein
MAGTGEMIMLPVAKIGKTDVGKLILVVRECQLEICPFPIRLFLLQVPLALFAPSEADGAAWHHDAFGSLIIGDGFPIGIVGLAEIFGKVGGAQQSVGNESVALLHQPNQHRHIGILPNIILKIFGLPIEIKLAQNDVAHGHGERRIGALLDRDPQIGKF